MVLEEKEFWKKFWLKISTKCQISNQEIYFWSKFELCFANSVRFWIDSFTTHQVLKTIFLKKNRYWRKLCFRKIIFGAFYNVKTLKLAASCFLLQKEPAKKTGMANSFWIRKNDTGVSDKQVFHNPSVLKESFYNVSDVESTFL